MLSKGTIRLTFSCLATAIVLISSPGSEALAPKSHSESMKGSTHGSFDCMVCHSYKRSAETPSAPLRNQSANTSRFEVYDSISEICLSCHDNIVAPVPPTSENWRCTAFPTPPDSEVKHHPYCVPYGYSPELDFLPPYVGENRRVRLFGAWGNSFDGPRVECASCHDPHHPENPKFLRVPPEQQELCKCCHKALPGLTRRVYVLMQKYTTQPKDCPECHPRHYK